MQCSKCLRDSIVFQPYSGLHLCGQHIIADVEAKAKKMIRAQGWLRPGDHIAVLLSGDKSSHALLYFLKKLTAQRRDIRITAITINDEKDTHCDTSHTKRIAEFLKTELLEVSCPKESEIKKVTEKNDISAIPFSPTSCSILLDRIAQQHGITKIASGLCLDDAAFVVLESVIKGDVEKLVKRSSCQDMLIRICPFIAITEAEVSLYAALCGFDEGLKINPEKGDRLHKDMVAMLESYTNNHPATKYALLNLGENLADPTTGITCLINACEYDLGYPQRCSNNSSLQMEVPDGTT